MVCDGVLEQVAHVAGVGEVLRLVCHAVLDELAGTLARGVRQHVLALGHVLLKDPHELVGRVVLEGDEVREARPQPRVRAQELLHEVSVAGDDDHKVVAVVLHGLEQRVHRLLAEVAVALAHRERVRLVDEEHAAERLVNNLGRARRRLADVAAHEPGAVDLHELPRAQNPQVLVDLREHAGHGGLARAGVAEKHHVLAHVGRGHAEGGAHLLHADEVDEARDLALDGVQAHERVELAQELLELGLLLFLGLVVRRGGFDDRVAFLRDCPPAGILADKLLKHSHVDGKA